MLKIMVLFYEMLKGANRPTILGSVILVRCNFYLLSTLEVGFRCNSVPQHK